MKFLVVFSCVFAIAFATTILPGAPIGFDGRVVDTAEVTFAKAAHAAAHVNERINLNREALHSADAIVSTPVAAAPLAIAAPAALPVAAPAVLPVVAPATLPLAAPVTTVLAADGRPLDTPEVAIAKASHLAAHYNERILHASEANRNFLAARGYSFN